MEFNSCNCDYCNFYTFPLLHYIKEIDTFWYEIPKNGSAVIKKRFNIPNLSKTYDGPTEIVKVHRTIAVVRDPVERFRSLIKHYFDPNGQRWHIGARFLFANGWSGDRNYLSQFVLDNLHKLNGITDEVHHFYPQSRFVPSEYIENIEFIHLDDLSKELGVHKYNHTDRCEEVNFTSKQINNIKEIYYNDYRLWKVN